MEISTTKFLLLAGLLGAATLAFPALVRAQAEPGPIHPPPSAPGVRVQPPPAPKPAPPSVPLKPPEAKDINGSWKLNRNESDDAEKKLHEARANGNGGNSGSGSGGGHSGVWGGGGGGGYPGGGGGYPGGGGTGYPGGQGGGGYPRPRGTGGESEQDREKMQELVNPHGLVYLALKDSEVQMTANEDGFLWVFYTDGRKVKKSKDEKNQEFSAHWEDFRLVSEAKGPHDAKITRTFEAAPGGQQLYETVSIDHGHGWPVTIRFVYDIVKPENQGKPAETATASSSSN
jgi:hypothetical protein